MNTVAHTGFEVLTLVFMKSPFFRAMMRLLNCFIDNYRHIGGRSGPAAEG
jgi:hypothetical protein